MRILIRTAFVAVLLALAIPASAMAAGKVNTNIGGDITYEGDGGANVVTVASVQSSPTSATLVIAETGITEGTDGANICIPGANSVTCTFPFTQKTLTLNGGAGADELTLDGPVGATIRGDADGDKLTGGDGPDFLGGGTGVDTLDGRSGDDTVDGGIGGDAVAGGRGEDRTGIADLGDDDRIDLGAGRDTFFVSNADGTGDALIGGDGVDTLQYVTFGNAGETPFSTVDLARGVFTHGPFGGYPAGTDSLATLENAGEFLGSSGPDVLIGDARPNVLAGGNGADKITGGAGTDTLLGDKSFSGADQMSQFGSGADTIDAFDGFEDQVDCGAAADSVSADQFDGSLAPECETIDVRQADPFGIPPAPQPQPQPQPEPGPGTGGETPGGGSTGDGPTGPQQETADVSAPQCKLSRLPAKKRAAFLKRGFTLSLECDEPARVDTTASLAAKGRPSARSLTPGDVVLGEKALDLGTGKRTVAFRVPRSVRRSLGRRFTVRLRVAVTDRAGNSTTTFPSFKVR